MLHRERKTYPKIWTKTFHSTIPLQQHEANEKTGGEKMRRIESR